MRFLLFSAAALAAVASPADIRLAVGIANREAKLRGSAQLLQHEGLNHGTTSSSHTSTGGTETTTTTGHGGTTTSSSTTGGPLPSTESITSSSGSGHGGGTACPPGFNNYCFFAIDVLVFLGAPRTHNNTISLVGWAQAGNNTCRFNPYNANASLTGSTACNSAGVQSYITWKEGVKATATAIEGPAYAQIYADLKASADPALTARDIAASQWGVGQQVVQLIEEANASPATYTQWAGTIVAGETDSTADLLAGA